jgi:serine/threonine protein kinase
MRRTGTPSCCRSFTADSRWKWPDFENCRYHQTVHGKDRVLCVLPSNPIGNCANSASEFSKEKFVTDSGSFWVGPTESAETYQLDALLGGGGEGEVWRGVLPLSDAGRSMVAIKIMRGAIDDADEAGWERFGHLLRSLAHPGLVRVTDVFLGPPPHRQGDPATGELSRYVVMDYVDGPTLRDWIDENPAATAAGRLALLRTVASALDEMHSGSRTEIPVAHGDVKPANIIVGPTGGTVLVDLGLARLTDGHGVSGRSNPYAAPELRESDAQATPAADAFAFAVTTAHVLTGQAPPTDQNGFLDLPALQVQLQTSPVTQRRPILVHQVMAVLSAAPEARPQLLRLWLDSAADTLSQVTTPPAAESVAVSGAAVPIGPEDATIIPTATGRAAAAPGPRRSHRRRNLLVSAVVILLVLGLGGVALALTQNHGRRPQAQNSQTPPPSDSASASDSSTPSDSTTPSGSATTSDSTTATDTTSPTDTTTGPADPTDTSSLSPTDSGPFPSSPPPATTQWVSAMSYVDYDRDSGEGSGLVQTGAFDTNGHTYVHSVRMWSGSCYNTNADGGDYWYEYDLAREWTVLTAVIGLEDGSPASSSMSWVISGDNKPLASGTQTLGTSRSLKISVKNVLRLRVKVNYPGSTNTRNCDHFPTMIFGNLELTA